MEKHQVGAQVNVDIRFGYFFMIECIDSMEGVIKQKDYSFKLIYIDPPYCTQMDFTNFSDKWENLEKYLDVMESTLTFIPSKLKDDGAFMLHCDYHASHYLKTMCDNIFGRENFANEIFTKRSAKNGRNPTRRLFTNLDSILFYWKDAEFGRIVTLPTRPADNSKERWSGLTAGGSGSPRLFFGKLIHPSNGRHFMWSQENITKACQSGRIRLNSNGNPEYRVERDNLPCGTLWGDIPAYRVGEYSTQKSEVLMQRIIAMTTEKNDMVGDFFCGSGTTLYMAKKMGRKYYGCDINPKAVKIAEKRISTLNGEIKQDEELCET